MSARVLTAPEAQTKDLDTWLRFSGGRAIDRALADPIAALATIRSAGLRGMGGAGYPTHAKWQAIIDAAGDEKWLVCNGNEDEPGTFKDGFLLESTPHQVIEGALATAAAIGAQHVALYVHPRERVAIDGLESALTAWRGTPLWAKLEQSLGALDVHVAISQGMYVGGEETAAIASLEGRFPFPRRKPPFPATLGVHGHPTLVHNVETIAAAGRILGHAGDDPAAWYRGLGHRGPGTKLYSLSGDVLRPGLYELPMGTTLRELLEVHGGGMLLDRTFKAAFTGGPSHTLLTRDDLDAPLVVETLRKRGARLGTGAMIIVSEDTSIVRKVTEYIEFFADSACGQCPPCRLGTTQMSHLLRRIERGEGTLADLEALTHFCAMLPGSGRCGLPDAATTVLLSALKHFRHEFIEALS